MALAACVGAGAQQLFPGPVVVPTGNWPVFVATADVNGDGSPDLVYIDQGATAAASTTHVLLNDGKGGFKESARIATAGTSVAVGDLTGSGHVDVGWLTWTQTGVSGAAISGTETLQIAPGRGDGSFGTTDVTTFAAVPVRKPAQLAYLTTGQFHSSGALDVVAEDVANNLIFTFRKAPSGSSSAVDQTFSNMPGGGGPMTVVDLNQDGRADVVVDGLAAGEAQIYLSQIGPATFGFGSVVQPTSTVTGVSGVRSLVVQDLNGDGRPDLVVEGAAGRLDVLPGNGDGTFAGMSVGGTGTLDGTTGNGGHLIAVADLNGDGQVDALTATPVGISALLGQGTAYLGLKGIYNAGPGRTSFVTADFNGDGKLDVAVDAPEGIAILYGNGDGSFLTSAAYAAGAPAMSGGVGVFTSSGNVDAVVAINSAQAQFLRGGGDGTFQAAAAPTTTKAGTAGFWGSVAVGDFNNDGPLDVVVTADGPPLPANALGVGVTVQYGQGDGTFKVPFLVGSHGNPGTAPYFGVSFAGTQLGAQLGPGGVSGFLNLDAGHLWTFNTPSLASNTPTSTLIATVSDAHAHNLVAAGVLRHGAAADVVAQDEGSLKVYLNSGTSIATTALGDLAVDGSLTTAGQMVAPDLAATFPGLSKGLGFRAFPGSAAIADLDGDGNGDLIVTYDNLDADHTAPSAARPNYVYVWFGSGGGKFLVSAKHPVNPVRFVPSRNYYQAVVADVNGDGVQDLILSDGYVVSVQYGRGDGTFGGENHFLAGQGVNTISVADVRHIGKMDLVVANGGTVFGNVVANKEVLTANANVDTGGITVLLNQSVPAATTGTLVAAPEPAAFEAAYSITATVGGAAVGGSNGTVDFSVDGTAVGTAAVVNGAATLNVPVFLPNAPNGQTPLLPGTHALSGLFRASQSALGTTLSGTHTVSLAPTTVTLQLTTPLHVYYGQPIDGKVIISLVDINYGAVGTYSVLSNGVLVPGCIDLPTNGFCPYGNPDLLDAGSYVLTLTYNGDTVNAPSLSPAYPFVVMPDLTTATLATSGTPANFGSAVTFTATIAGNAAVPNGTVQFFDGGVLLGSGTLDTGGMATLTTTSLSVGVHTITATYAGNNNFNPAAAGALRQEVVSVAHPLASQVFLTSSLNPAPKGANVTFTATVEVAGPFGQIATGAISFLDGSVVIGTGTLNALGVATFSTSTLAVGGHPVTAAYGGDGTSGGGLKPPVPPRGPARRR